MKGRLKMKKISILLLTSILLYGNELESFLNTENIQKVEEEKKFIEIKVEVYNGASVGRGMRCEDYEHYGNNCINEENKQISSFTYQNNQILMNMRKEQLKELIFYIKNILID